MHHSARESWNVSTVFFLTSEVLLKQDFLLYAKVVKRRGMANASITIVDESFILIVCKTLYIKLIFSSTQGAPKER